MIPVKSLPLRVSIGLVLAIVLDTVLQLVWKTAALSIPAGDLSAAQLFAMATHPSFMAVGILLVLQLVNWTKVLAHADLSYAQPITALSYITVIAMSALLLHESITVQKIAGVVIVFIGVWLISRTDHRTDAPGESGA